MTTTTRARWGRLTAAATLAATAADAALLQRKWNFFTGGFLTAQFTSTWTEVIWFLAGSIAADAAVLGIAVAALLAWTRRLTGPSLAASVAIVGAALVPVALADAISYELASYFGAGFDVAMMFDLVSRRPLEFLAVSASTERVVAAGAGMLLLAGLAYWLMRRSRARPDGLDRVGRTPMWRAAGLLLAAGTVVSTGLRVSSDTINAGLIRKPTARLLELVVNALSDVDRDGYGLIGRLSDPDVFDAHVHPYAPDIPGNGVDEDGVGGDLPAAEPATHPSGTLQFTRTPNVVVVMLESVRDDVVGSSVGGVPVTPVLDALAARGLRLTRAYSHNGYTVQSRWHTLSGSLDLPRVPPGVFDDFAANGYETASFSAQDDSFGGPEYDVGYSRAQTKYDARQDAARRYTAFVTPGSLAVSGNVLLERVRGFLEARRRDRPLFLYVNFHDTHYPYAHRDMRPLLPTAGFDPDHITPGGAAALRAGYANAVANVDRYIGELLDSAARALGGPPAVVVLSDHGESLFDDGRLGHGFELNDQQTKIPFIAAGLPLMLEEPFGQADVRDALRDALSRPNDVAPRARTVSERRVFQYLGELNRPGQIALRGVSDLTIYDFRLRRVRFDDGDWMAPSQLSGDRQTRFLDLVRRWESMVLAEAGHTR